jgi:hypothetical protein
MIMDQPTMRASLDEPSGEIVTVSFVPSPSSEKRSVDRPIFPVGGSQVQDERVALRGYRGEGDAVACRQLGRIRPFRRVLAIITFPVPGQTGRRGLSVSGEGPDRIACIAHDIYLPGIDCNEVSYLE